MTLFSQNDFKEEPIRLKLNAIIMDKLLLSPLTPFSKLEGNSIKKKYNIELQQYIKSLNENWNEIMTNDFNLIMGDYMSSNNFQPENLFIPTITTKN